MAVALGALLLPGHRPLSLVALVSSIAAYAVTSRVEVEFPGFVAIPTEAIFVVMWFVLPVRMLPLAVCAAMVLGRLPDVLRGRMPADRLGLTVASCWYSVGPALVLYLAGIGAPRWSYAPILLAALAAQFLFDSSRRICSSGGSSRCRSPTTSGAPRPPTDSISCSRRSASSRPSRPTTIPRRCCCSCRWF